MKKMNKLLSVIVALMLCVSMIAPALAANFTDLQNAIDGVEGNDLGDGRYGYGKNDDGTYGIEAWNDGDVRNVKLNENVTREEGESGISVRNESAKINLNGNDIDGNGVDSSVISIQNATVTIDGADETGENRGAITGGNAEIEYGGGLNITDSTVELNNVEITGNHAMRGGGAYIDYDSDVQMNNVEISGNDASGENPWETQGGGLYIGGGSTVGLNNVDITKNHASDGGGGAYIIDSNVTFDRVSVNENRAGFAGGVEVNYNSKVTIKNSEINGNTAYTDESDPWATGNGGGMLVEGGATATITDTKIIGNKAAASGGGIHIYTMVPDDDHATKVTIDNCDILDNEADTFGGAISVGAYSYDEVKPLIESELTINHSTISGNKTAASGGGIYAWDSSVKVDGSNISNNRANESGDDLAGVNVKLIMTNDKSLGGTLAQDNEEITGWYWDYSGDYRWNSDNYTEQDMAIYDGTLNSFALKAAHGAVPTTPGPVNPGPGPDPVNPDPVDPDPEDPVEIEDPETPLGEEPEDPIDIDDPEIPLGELPEIEIDEPEVPLSDVPQTGDISFLWYGAVVVPVMGLLALSLLERKKAQESQED